MDVTDRIIVVTGGAAGIGRALCRRFATEGARAVIVADRNGEGARSLARDIGGTAVVCDVRKEQDIAGLVRDTENRIGPIDLFCSNAGILAVGGVEVSDDQWQNIWEVNVMSHVYAGRAVIPRMISRGGGALMITASAAGLLSQIGSAPYSTTKHAAVGLAENMAISYGGQGILVFALCPQAVRTDMIQGAEEGGVAGVDGVMEPDDVAEAVIQGLRDERFLILPHPEVAAYLQRKAADHDRWIRGMQRLQARYLNGAPLKG